MSRKSDDISSLFGIIFGLIGVVFIIIGYSITFLEKVDKYHQWAKFWLTFPFLCFGNYFAYLNWNTKKRSSDYYISYFVVKFYNILEFSFK